MLPATCYLILAICYNLAVIIDFHTHIFPPRVIENRDGYVQADPCFAALYSDKKAKLATAEELIASMDRDGIDISVALNIGWATHELCVETNDYIMEAVSQYSKRLIGFGAVQPNALKQALKEIERLAKGGARGIGEMRPDIQQIDLNNRSIMHPFIQALKERGLILLTHASEPVGHQYDGKGALTPEVIYNFIADHPGLTIVLAHWGGGLPFYALMPEVRRAMKDVYFDTAASPFLYNPQIYKQVSQMAGVEKILFGTDYPLIKQGRGLEEVKTAGLTAKERNLILGGNAKRLLGI